MENPAEDRGPNLIKLWGQMDDKVKNWTNLWQEESDWCLPHKDNITRIRVAGQENPPQRMIDTCVEANFNFASGLYSHMFPAGTIWAKYKHPSPDIMREDGVADWFELASREAHRLLIESNFAQEIQESLLDLGCFGTNNVYVEEDDDSVVRFRSFTVADFRILTNNKGMVDTVGRKLSLTARQMLQEFGEEALTEAGLSEIVVDVRGMTNSEDKKYEVIHIVMPRVDYDSEKITSENLPYASYYICKKTQKVIRESGYDYNPYFVGRFTVGNGDDYGTSPMSMVLATSRRTNAIYRSMIVSAENHANPQWLMPDDDSVSFKTNPNRAGALVYWRAANAFGKPERLAPNGDPGIALEMFQLHDSSIKRAFFNHLFRPLDDYRNMTAFEANQRMTTDRMALSPFINRYQDEVVSPMLTYIFYLMQKRGMLPDMPPALLETPEFEIEYVGPLSLATRSFEVAGAFQTIQMFAETSKFVPQFAEVFHNINVDDLFKQTWYTNSASMNVLESKEDVEAKRALIAQQQQQQQMAQAAPMLADAYNKAGKAPEEGSAAARMTGES